MEKRFLILIAEVMDVEREDISMETRYEEFEKWDSLMMLNLIMECEQEFNIIIPMEKIGKISTLGDLYALTGLGS